MTPPRTPYSILVRSVEDCAALGWLLGERVARGFQSEGSARIEWDSFLAFLREAEKAGTFGREFVEKSYSAWAVAYYRAGAPNRNRR